MAMQNAIVRKYETRIKRLEAELAAERSLWESDTTVDRTSRGNPKQMHTLEALDNILHEEKALHACSGLTSEEYEYLFELYDEEIDRLGKTPLFKEDEYRKSDQGNRCKLYKRHALLLILTHLYTGLPQQALGAIFGIDQSAVSRYLALNRRVLEKILPTAKTISAAIAKLRESKAVEQFLPGDKRTDASGDLWLDGARCPLQRPTDKELQKETYSGKVKMHSINTLFGTNKDGIIVWTSSTQPGSTHDIKMTDELAKIFPSVAVEGGVQIRVIADLGFLGMDKRLPGITVLIPEKRPKNGQLTKKQKERNKKISSKRVRVEHDIGRAKNYKILKRPYGGTPSEFNRELNIVTGLVNLHTLFSQLRNGSGLYGTLMAKRRKAGLKRHRRR